MELNEYDIAAWRCSEGVETTKYEFVQSCRGKENAMANYIDTCKDVR